MKRAHLLVVTSVLFFLPALADAKLGGATDGWAKFDASGPGGMKIEGKSTEVSVKEDGDKVKVSVGLTNMATGIQLRDKHMREKYLEVGKYPNAELTVARSALKIPASGEASGTAQGTMRIHGQNKDVPFSYTAKKSGDGFDVNGTAKVNMKDYGIDVPSYLGVTVKPDVDVAVHFVVKDQ